MVRFDEDTDDGQDRKAHVISPLWLAEEKRRERDEVFDDTVREFLERDNPLAVVEYEPTGEGVTCLLAAITRLDVHQDVDVYEDAGRIILKKKT